MGLMSVSVCKFVSRSAFKTILNARYSYSLDYSQKVFSSAELLSKYWHWPLTAAFFRNKQAENHRQVENVRI